MRHSFTRSSDQMRILGISAYYHDAAACLLVDGEIKCAAQEERFTRIKHDASFPIHAIRFCLEYSNIKPSEVDYVIFYDKPFLKFERILETYLAFAPRGFRSFSLALPGWIKDKLFQKSQLVQDLTEHVDQKVQWTHRLAFSEHHLSHAASAFFPSPFESAAILTMDGVGEWTTTSIGVGDGNNLTIEREIQFPHSIGLLYSAFTYYLGFRVNSGEYKVMGLAPYGKPKYTSLIKENLIDIKSDGSFALNLRYFDYCTGLTMTNEAFHQLFGGSPRTAEGMLETRHLDIAASIQAVTEEIVLTLGREVSRQTGARNLCLAGGVALNCVANGKLSRANVFDRIWIQPAAGDAGGAVGAALALYYQLLGRGRVVSPCDGMKGALLGPEYSQNDIEKRLLACGACFNVLEESELLTTTAQSLANGMAVGWMNGRMEFGPRALGARSILADPRSPMTQRQLNLKIKFRESFRPFAPSVREEDANEWFDLRESSPYMLLVSEVEERNLLAGKESVDKLVGLDKQSVQLSTIPAVTHVDGTARVQTVSRDINPRFHGLLTRFKEITGCPVLVNTSFNVRGEPIVNTPEDAFRCFLGTGLDVLVVGNCFLEKSKQTKTPSNPHHELYPLD
ncbi:carbamoyltransferase [Limnohabitans sp. Hippo3]|uniref:carbamoyltransferase family protein n=1 Tax=Limnohabitans sp. Hippo3 TaxID=1597956 RepID=UPI0035130197